LPRSLLLLAALSLAACATPGSRYFAGDATGCDDFRAARTYAAEHPELSADVRAEALLDLARCEAEAEKPGDVEPLLLEAETLAVKARATADAERAALRFAAAPDEAVALFKNALGEGFADLDLVLDGKEFAGLVEAPALERYLLALAASADPVEPRVVALARRLKQHPVSPVVVDANPAFGLNTFALWRGRVLEAHYDANNDETTVLLEEVVSHAHPGAGREAHQHVETVWTPGGFVRQPHAHLSDEQAEEQTEYEATSRLFGLRLAGFPRELVEAPDLEVVGYYSGRTPFDYRGERGEAPTLQAVRAVPFNSGVHPGRPVAHE
jgi:hypothetical protein